MIVDLTDKSVGSVATKDQLAFSYSAVVSLMCFMLMHFIDCFEVILMLILSIFKFNLFVARWCVFIQFQLSLNVLFLM